MKQLSLFVYHQRPWLKRLALEALRLDAPAIDLDMEELRIYPVRRDESAAPRHLPRYRVKSTAWLIDLHQLLNSMALHRDDARLARIALQAKLDELEEKFRANEVFYRADVNRMLEKTELLPPRNVPPPWAVGEDDIPF